MIVPSAFATGWHLALVSEFAPTPRFLLSLAFLSLIDTAATTVAQFVEARRSRLDELTSWTFRTPLFRVMLGWWLLGERPAGWAAMGLIATVAAMTVALHAQRQPRPCEQQAFGGTPTGNRRAPATRWAHKEAGNDDS